MPIRIATFDFGVSLRLGSQLLFIILNAMLVCSGQVYDRFSRIKRMAISKLNGNYHAFASIFILLLTSLQPATAQDDQTSNLALKLSVGKPQYMTGDTAIVQGSVGVYVENQPVLFRLYAPLGALARSDLIDVFQNGAFYYEFPAGGPRMTQAGTYRVVVNYGSAEAEESFLFTEPIGGDSWYVIMVDGQEYTVRYLVYGGTIENITADPESSSLVISITPTRETGNLKIEFPRELIQAQDVGTGNDIPFTVFVNGMTANFTEIPGLSKSRAIEIAFDANTSVIVITGTWIIPEFSSLALIIMAGSVAGLIVWTGTVRKMHSSYG